MTGERCLPPNPITPMLAALIDKASGAGTAETIWQLLQEFANQAIEADRKRLYRPVYEEGWKDALEWADRYQRSEARKVCAEAYQVVGSLLSDLGIFETDRAEKILDNLSQARMVHKDVLPWQSHDRQRGGEPVYQFRKKGCADWYDGYPDHSDGGGPYEIRTLFSAPQPAAPVVKGSLTAAEPVAKPVSVTQKWQDGDDSNMVSRVAEPVKDVSDDFDDAIDAVAKAMSKAWQLGQTYWQQADSDYSSQWKKSDATQEKFNTLMDETRALLARYGSKS